MSLVIGIMLRGQYSFGVDMVDMASGLLEQARLADKLGYASITKGSHYSTPYYQALQQLPILARLTGEVKTARLNAGIVILPLHKPLDIAEQLATIDILSNGRLIFGVGIGYREVEFNAFGMTHKERGVRTTENLIAIKRLWSENSVTMKGSHFWLRDAVCWPKPMQKPTPPIWIGANADRALKRAAELGDCWYINPHTTIETLTKQVEVYKRELDIVGKPFPKEFPMRREAFVAPTRSEALRLAAPFVAKKYASYHATGQSDQLPKGESLSGDFNDLVGDRFLIGSPEEVADQIININRKLGVNHLILSMEWTGMEKSIATDCLHLMAEEVFPKVSQAT
ncbi:MAG: LLM class flavin-dependent oxidoreductase [Rhodospirillaceae bacterium]|nr:LLM class flavin-dependent oxidoreductase [Rhodospirillaceae bacterium]|tara:strand:+ start:2279 stop:3298 length:1020 start_codon:yes stop_codon:yes gene_type:complete